MTLDFWRNLLAEYHNYFHQVVRQIDEWDEEYGDAPGWQKKRTELLIKAGESAKVAFAVTQTISGNISTSDSRASTTFTDEEWKKNSDYSQNALESKKKTDTMAELFFDQVEDSVKKDEYKKLLSYNALLDAKGPDTIDADKAQNLKDLINGQVGVDLFSSDPDRILDNLRKYTKIHPNDTFE